MLKSIIYHQKVVLLCNLDHVRTRNFAMSRTCKSDTQMHNIFKCSVAENYPQQIQSLCISQLH
jgi:hypothetical protein